MDVLQGITGLDTAQRATSSSAADAESKKLGRDDFLTMFLAQLKNQDPLNPMEGTEFSSQLAQFSSLEQLFNVNDNLQSMITSQEDSSRLQAVEFIGKEITAAGDTLSLEEGKAVTGQFDLEAAADCTVRILNEEGLTVKTIPMGYLGAGSQTFQWDGRDGAGNAMGSGVYTFQVAAMNSKGTAVNSETRLSGTVTGVNLESNPVNLYVGDIPVAIGSIKDIRSPSTAGTGTVQ